MTLAHNRFERNDTIEDEIYAGRLELDIEGDQRRVIDANDRVAMVCAYDLQSRQIHQASMEAGERWLLSDVAGKIIYAWDSRGHRTHMTYDALRRPAQVLLSTREETEQLVTRNLYGESLSDAETHNAKRQSVQVFDQSGVVTNDDYDFKGNLLRSHRRFARDYNEVVDWSASPALETETFVNIATFDALNRLVALTTPEGSVHRAAFNEANLLDAIEVDLPGNASATSFVDGIAYDAKGRRIRIDYGNGVSTAYTYDPLTLRLTKLKSVRSADQMVLQDLRYTYDPAGNICHIADAAQQIIYFANQDVSADNDYSYDALYRLIRAEGREHIGQAALPPTSRDAFRLSLPHPSDGQAMRRYTEQYVYDRVGNMLSQAHQAAGGNWTRASAYAERSFLESDKINNRLSGTTVGTSAADAHTYDAHGNIISMSHLTMMRWDFRDQLAATARQAVNDGSPETTFYVYDLSGERVRKVTQRSDGTRKTDRLYLGGLEVYREYAAGTDDIALERQSLHVADNGRRVALIETRTQKPVEAYRYSRSAISLPTNSGQRAWSWTAAGRL